MDENKLNSTTLAAVPDETQQSLLNSSKTDVKSRLGPVANFGESKRSEEQIILDEIDVPTGNKEFLGLTKEELKEYINSAKWKRIRLIIGLIYLLAIVLLLLGSVYLIFTSQRCPPKKELTWFEREIIYEVDVPFFRDSNGDGVGDIQGLISRLNYFEKNRIQSILLQSTLFNLSLGTSTILNGTDSIVKKLDLFQIDPKIGRDSDLDELTKTVLKKNMHLIIDLPLSSTYDPTGQIWYGATLPFPNPIENPCIKDKRSLGCLYYEFYGRFPLDFNVDEVFDEAESRLKHWLSMKKFDGVRVDLPLEFDKNSNAYKVSTLTINRWFEIKKKIEAKSKTKLLFFDVPSALREFLDEDSPNFNLIPQPVYFSKVKDPSAINSHQLAHRFELSPISKTRFWKLGSKRRSDELGIPTDQQIPREFLLTLMMLTGPTPIFLYGDELSLDQKSYPFMPWISDGLSGGFTACTKEDCPSFYKAYRPNPFKISVQRQEAVGGQSKESLLKVFRYLASLREYDSFLFGDFVSGHDEEHNFFWFIREAPGHNGFVVLLNLHATEQAHISLHDVTEQRVPFHVHCHYQWPKIHLSTSNSTYINSDNLIVDPQSINIFWWKAKLMDRKLLPK